MIRGTCPVRCGRDADDGKMMCGPCWGKVPKALQRSVFSAQRALRNGPSAERAGLRYDLETARDAAIESVRG